MIISDSTTMIENEGDMAGKTVFKVRTAKCSLKCNFCESKNLEGQNVEADALIKKLTAESSKGYFFEYVSITGKNPLEQDLDELLYFIRRVQSSFRKIHIKHPGIFINRDKEIMLLSYANSIYFDLKAPSSGLDENLILDSANIYRYALTNNFKCHRMHKRCDMFQIYQRYRFFDEDDINYLKNIFHTYPILSYIPTYFYPILDEDNNMAVDTVLAIGTLKEKLFKNEFGLSARFGMTNYFKSD